MRASRALSTGLAALLLAHACANEDEDPPPIPDDAPNEAAAEVHDEEGDDDAADEIDVSTVPSNPDDIDEAYLDAVVAELSDLFVAAAVVYREVGDVDDSNVREMMLSAYTESAANAQLAALEGLGQGGIADLPDPPTTEILEIVDREADCVFFTAARDFGPALSTDADYDPVQPYYLRLQRVEPDDSNPTAWKLDLDGYFNEPIEVEKGVQCDG